MRAPTLAALTFVLVAVTGLDILLARADSLPPDATYRPLPALPLDVVRRNDEAAKTAVQRRQQGLLEQRYDLADRPMPGVKMSGGRKGVQTGVRVKLQSGATWDQLAQKSSPVWHGHALITDH